MSRLLVLGWHNLTNTDALPLDDARAARGFARQVRWLRRAANPVPLGPALRALSEGRRLPPRAVALTFDDGYRDNVEVAAPILTRLGVPATFFLVTGFLDGRLVPWWERLARAWSALPATTGTAARREVPPAGPERRRALLALQRELKSLDSGARDAVVQDIVDAAPGDAPAGERLMMDWDDARRLVRDGFEIGSHTDTHPVLARETAAAQADELAAARTALRGGLGVEADIVAYPNGSAADVSRDTVAAAAEAGYRFGLTTVWGVNRPDTDPLLVRRVLVPPTRLLQTLRWDLAARPWSRPGA